MHDPIPNPTVAPPYLHGLNPEQRDAVETINGPLLVLAGAGTGKTRVLTTRLAHLLHTNQAFRGQILSVTFTNKAAQEMKERVSHLMGGQPVEGWWLGTFHALAARMLRRHADLVGLSSNFTILDTDDQLRLLKQIMVLEGVDHKKWAPRAMMGFIDRWKDRALLPSQVDGGDVSELAGGKLPKLYEIYQSRLKAVNACDFGDLLLHMTTIFKDPANAGILADYHRRFKYIMVDEYQDTNVAQYLWLRLLAQGSNNVCCVGDDDQSIYGWRGAEVGNILRFEKDFEGAKIIRLEQNYRSTNHILKAAGAVIFEERFIKLGLAYKVIGGPRFYERQEIRDALAYLRITMQPADDLALERIINKPKRGLGDATVAKLYEHARLRGISLHDSILDLTQTDELRPKVKATLMGFVDLLERWRSLMDNTHHAELAGQILEDSGYLRMWKDDKTPEAPGRLENLKELISGLQEFENLQDFLEHVALVMENQEEEGLFPSQRSMDESGMKGLEEERRLAYVGITRAKKKAHITFVGNRLMYGNWVNSIPSRFVDELPAEHVELSSELSQPQAQSGGGRSSHWDSSGFKPAARYATTRAPRTKKTYDRKVQTEDGLILGRGDRIFHDKFGYGKIINIDGHKLDIAFEKSGTKRVMDSFVEKVDS